MKEYFDKSYSGERSMFSSIDSVFNNCTFHDGESPLKESKNIDLESCTFQWKYPLWYCNDVKVNNTTWLDTARSGVWYTNNIEVTNCTIDAPKQFRRCCNVYLENVRIINAIETMWMCKDVVLKNCYIKGDYFGLNCTNITLIDCTIDGNYCFDGSKNVKCINSIFNSKDSFWNCVDVLVKDSKIIGEYLAWNTTNILLDNCYFESNQGLCYINKLTLNNCKCNETYLAFEFCKDINCTLNSRVNSIKNPINGYIKCLGYDDLILDKEFINPSDTIIEVK